MATDTEPLAPIRTEHLFARLDAALVELLRSLTPEEWQAPTIAGRWKVRDVAAHLLDTALRRISMCRDGHFAETPEIDSPEALTAFINRVNREGVEVFGRLSPPLLISLTEEVTRQLAEYFESLDPMAEAMFAVSWAGEDKSANWFDVAREFTERWHHQQQIRLAVDKPGILKPKLYHPVLDCFMRALPFTYRSVTAPAGSLAKFIVSGECGGTWNLHRGDDKWKLTAEPVGEEIAATTIPQEIAWRIFTKGIAPDEAESQIEVSGDKAAGLHILKSLAIIA